MKMSKSCRVKFVELHNGRNLLNEVMYIRIIDVNINDKHQSAFLARCWGEWVNKLTISIHFSSRRKILCCVFLKIGVSWIRTWTSIYEQIGKGQRDNIKLTPFRLLFGASWIFWDVGHNLDQGMSSWTLPL